MSDSGVGVRVSVGVEVAVGDEVAVGVRVAVLVAVGVDVGVRVGVRVAVAVDVGVKVKVGKGVGVKVGVGVANGRTASALSMREAVNPVSGAPNARQGSTWHGRAKSTASKANRAMKQLMIKSVQGKRLRRWVGMTTGGVVSTGVRSRLRLCWVIAIPSWSFNKRRRSNAWLNKSSASWF
jgi:hypothetical protein